MLNFMLGIVAATFLLAIGICIKDTLEDQKEKFDHKVKYTVGETVSERLKTICVWQIPGLGDYIKETVDDYLVEKEEKHEQKPWRKL